MLEDFECSQHKEMISVWGDKNANFLDLIINCLYIYENTAQDPMTMQNYCVK